MKCPPAVKRRPTRERVPKPSKKSASTSSTACPSRPRQLSKNFEPSPPTKRPCRPFARKSKPLRSPARPPRKHPRSRLFPNSASTTLPPRSRSRKFPSRPPRKSPQSMRKQLQSLKSLQWKHLKPSHHTLNLRRRSRRLPSHLRCRASFRSLFPTLNLPWATITFPERFRTKPSLLSSTLRLNPPIQSSNFNPKVDLVAMSPNLSPSDTPSLRRSVCLKLR